MNTVAPSPAVPILKVDELLALPDLEWLIEGVLPKPGVAILYGEPGCGKTFAALSMALTCAAGQDWLARPTCPARVLYIAGEGAHGLKTRVRAHKQKFGLKADNVRFVAKAISFVDKNAICALIEELSAQHFEPDLVVIDTFARASPGVDENSAKEVGNVIAIVDEFKALLSATILIIHHTRKDGGSERGSSALRGAADAMIKCEPLGTAPDIGVKLTCDKMKDGPEFAPISAHLEVVKFKNGETSLVLGELGEFVRGTNGQAEAFRQLLGGKFAETGATHSELKGAYVTGKHGSSATFGRALKEIRKTDLIVERMVDGKNRFFLSEVSSITPVS